MFLTPENGLHIHGMCVRTGFEWFPVVGNSTMDMYSRCGRIREAEKVFDEKPVRGGFPIFSQTIIAGALVDLYVKRGSLFEVRLVFDQLEQKSEISWSAVILGYAEEGNLMEATDLFRQLRDNSSIRGGGFVLSSMMGAFADFALVEQGKQIHCYTVIVPSGLETSVTNSIVDMHQADAGCWKEYERVRESAKMKGLKKEGGCSWVEIDKEIHFLYKGDERHALTEEIQEMNRRVKEEVGYAYEVSHCPVAHLNAAPEQTFIA
ncbi:tetratricopeptide repeat (TPR)-like superfamily protein [Actinidia rufa]|uniref:Tetratricopeptide repeat (TPR)-like superfamily protein n=1 Tax=Actinidia rufa TaxID=165716 RepID=A0A7J0DJD0_9ERIC|nr:tetratricopeptide repeat (TPR)-like superfamily protein [Actinidia rufa]